MCYGVFMDEAMTPSQAGETEMIRLTVIQNADDSRTYILDGKRVSRTLALQAKTSMPADATQYVRGW
jgi:aspartate 1-decarboxylase